MPRASSTPSPCWTSRDRVLLHNERGLLGLAFHPAFEENGRFFVTYSQADDGATSISEFTCRAVRAGLGGTLAEPTEAPRPVEATERPLLVIPQVYTTHKAGMLAFDHDGMLVIGIGDGGSGNDPHGHGLDRWSLLGKLLRLDVDARLALRHPRRQRLRRRPDGRAEVHAIGLRNPWRFSIDRASGDIYIGDVGQGAWEEIDVLPHGTRGASFGWSDMEGPGCLGDRACDPAAHIAPAIAYPHVAGEGRTARSSAATPTAAAARRCPRAPTSTATTAAAPSGRSRSPSCWPATRHRSWSAASTRALGPLQSFGEDDEGELYVVTDGGHILQVATAAP